MSMKILREAVASARRDEFDNGTVIRWTASERYTYVAVKTEVGWFTTARSMNSFVPQVVDFDELLEILARSETTNVAVATSWVSVVDEDAQGSDDDEEPGWDVAVSHGELKDKLTRLKDRGLTINALTHVAAQVWS